MGSHPGFGTESSLAVFLRTLRGREALGSNLLTGWEETLGKCAEHSTVLQGVSGSFGMTGERSRASRVLDGNREVSSSS